MSEITPVQGYNAPFQHEGMIELNSIETAIPDNGRTTARSEFFFGGTDESDNAKFAFGDGIFQGRSDDILNIDLAHSNALDSVFGLFRNGAVNNEIYVDTTPGIPDIQTYWFQHGSSENTIIINDGQPMSENPDTTIIIVPEEEKEDWTVLDIENRVDAGNREFLGSNNQVVGFDTSIVVLTPEEYSQRVQSLQQ